MFQQRSPIGDNGTRRSTTRVLCIVAFLSLILSFLSIEGIGKIVGSPQFDTLSTSQLDGQPTLENGLAAGGHSHQADRCSHHTTCASSWAFPTNTEDTSRVSSKRFSPLNLLAMRDRLDALDTPPPKYT